jgi:hypothetical protein
MIHQTFTCKLCGSVISDTGLCDYACEQDTVMVKHRKPGSVTVHQYQLQLVKQWEQ